MSRTASVVGTEYINPDGSSRRYIIRRFVHEDMHVILRHEPHDINVIAVYVPTPRLFGLLGTTLKQIGYLKTNAAKGIAKIIDAGGGITGRVGGYYVPHGKRPPRVTLVLKY
jgi:hypothetical protein